MELSSNKSCLCNPYHPPKHHRFTKCTRFYSPVGWLVFRITYGDEFKFGASPFSVFFSVTRPAPSQEFVVCYPASSTFALPTSPHLTSSHHTSPPTHPKKNTMQNTHPTHPALSIRPFLTGFDSTISNGQLEFVYHGLYSSTPCRSLFAADLFWLSSIRDFHRRVSSRYLIRTCISTGKS